MNTQPSSNNEQFDLHFGKINSDKALHYYSANREVKIPGHNYGPIYTELLKKYDDKEFSLLEIGTSLFYSDQAMKYNLPPDYIGSCIWKELYPKVKLYGFDINKYESNEIIKMYHGDQSCDHCLNQIEEDEFDIIIDDGSHINNHQQFSFFKLFNKIKQGGTYIIEDCHSDFDYYTDDKESYDKNNFIYDSDCSICKNYKFDPIKKGISTFELMREWYNKNWIIPDSNNNFMTTEDKVEINIHLTNRRYTTPPELANVVMESGTIEKPVNGSIIISIKKL